MRLKIEAHGCLKTVCSSREPVCHNADGRSACEVNLRSCHQGVREVKLCFEKERAPSISKRSETSICGNARKNMAGSGASEELSLPIPVLKIVEGTEENYHLRSPAVSL